MAVFKKKRSFNVQYDPDKQYPVIRASICNGERVAGFRDKESGRFSEVLYIATENDLKAFKDAYGIEDIKTEY
ncbi:MAG: aspartate dehydrogenase [Lachnospiraceae bacterium]|nr:aspartate dehydrogenase [Lachnospiraceae bacterium]